MLDFRLYYWTFVKIRWLNGYLMQFVFSSEGAANWQAGASKPYVLPLQELLHSRKHSSIIGLKCWRLPHSSVRSVNEFNSILLILPFKFSYWQTICNFLSKGSQIQDYVWKIACFIFSILDMPLFLKPSLKPCWWA